MSWFPERLDVHAIFVPSGDHVGDTSVLGLVVNCRVPTPVVRIQMSKSPERLESNAIWVPKD